MAEIMERQPTSGMTGRSRCGGVYLNELGKDLEERWLFLRMFMSVDVVLKQIVFISGCDIIAE
jgi:hypothetical protein